MKFLITSFIFCILFPLSACHNENSEEIVLRINHHEAISNCFFYDLVFLTQREEQFETDIWSTFCSQIEGFEYELGYIYELNVLQKDIENPPQDSSSLEYELINIISKEKITDDVEFEIQLRRSFTESAELFLTGNTEIGFSFLNQLNISCNENCSSLSELLDDDQITNIYGVFNHSELENTIEFVRLEER